MDEKSTDLICLKFFGLKLNLDCLYSNRYFLPVCSWVFRSPLFFKMWAAVTLLTWDGVDKAFRKTSYFQVDVWDRLLQTVVRRRCLANSETEKGKRPSVTRWRNHCSNAWSRPRQKGIIRIVQCIHSVTDHIVWVREWHDNQLWPQSTKIPRLTPKGSYLFNTRISGWNIWVRKLFRSGS